MDDDFDDDEYDPLDPALVAARDDIGRAIQKYAALKHKDRNPYVVAWAIGYEWTNSDLEQKGRAGLDTAMPTEQLMSASAGLGHYLVNQYS